MGKKTNWVRVAGVLLLLCGFVIGAGGCGGSSSPAPAGTEDAVSASENNASRALDTSGMSITTTVPSN